ncbi:hypothetical protein V6R21_11215 [Limibacter armeniacum]|uniref:hypothetical protein n=1 Tax=Limibacter armeniacum TaxID=466084 RepID=UPI002FE5D2FD
MHYFLKALFLYILFIIPPNCYAQKESTRVYNSTSIFLQLFGPEFLGVNLNYNINKRASLNLGLGVLLDGHIGTNIYVTDRSYHTSSMYIGTQAALINYNPIFGSSSEMQIGLYIPIGYEYIAKKGFTIQFDIGPNLVRHDWGQANTEVLNASLKIGTTIRSKK